MSEHVFSLLLFARYFFLAFGLLTIIGGIMGYVKAQSMASLIAGGVLGALLIAAGVLLHGVGTGLLIGKVLGLVVSLLLLGRFAPALVRGKMMPAAYIVPLSAIGAVVSVVLLIGAE